MTSFWHPDRGIRSAGSASPGPRPRIAALARAATLSLAAALALGSCSSAPKRAAEELARKNEAAQYAKLADDFFFKGQYSQALSFYGEALDAHLSVDNVEGAVLSRNSIGRAFLALGRAVDAEREFADALRDARAYGAPTLVAQSLSNMGELHYARGEREAAGAAFAEAEPLVSASDPLAAVIAHNRGVLALALGELDQAQAYLGRAEAANERAKRWAALGTNRYVLASLANARGDAAGALAWAKKALEADKRGENSLGIGADLEALALLSRKAGEAGAALDYYRRALGLWLSLGRDADAQRCAKALAELAEGLGEEALARRYAAMAAGSSAR